MQLKEYFFKIRFLYLFLPVKFLMKLAKKKVIFPFYHFVSKEEVNLVNNLYKPKTVKEFVEDIKFFKNHFYALSVKDFVNKDFKESEFAFFLSFDDGLSNFFHIVEPILSKEKISAINFLNSSFIDNKRLFYRYKVNLLIEFISIFKITKRQKKEISLLLNLNFNKKIIFFLKNATINDDKELDKLAEVLGVSFDDFLKNEAPYLTKSQIKILIDKGFYFGAHSKNHPRYSLMNINNQLKETLESVNEVKEQFNLRKGYFSFPFSDDGVTEEFFKKIMKEEVISFGSSGLKDEDNGTHFQRIPMEYNSVYSAETIIKGELVYYILKRILGKHKSIRKRN